MLKRLIDITGALFALIIFTPLVAFTAWRVAKTMGSPVLFRQVRPGLDGKPPISANSKVEFYELFR